LKSISGKELARIERQGWKLLRVAGSHHIYGKEGSIVRLSIPVHATGRSKQDSCDISWRWPR
jgi:predicted RNA binding protein YcfA (HicA-like mRNA interferase family)